VTLSVGVVGAGNMARVHGEAWQAIGADVAYVLGRGNQRTLDFADTFDARVAATTADLTASVDVVDICSPTDTHLTYIAETAAAEVPIVCEKPLARTGDEARDAVAICTKAGVPLLPAHVLRFFPEYRVAKERVDAGDVGDVAVVRLNRSTYLPSGASDWFRDDARSGGVVLDLMFHDIDYAAWIAGPVVSAYAKRGTAGGGDHVLATLRHTNGAISHIQGSWAFPKGTFTTSLEIAGTKGAIERLPGAYTSFFSDLGTDVADVPEPPTTGESPYVAQLRHFASVLSGEEEQIVTAAEAADAVVVCDAVAESIRTRRAVEVRAAS
jgi:predicted dehydrogenase